MNEESAPPNARATTAVVLTVVAIAVVAAVWADTLVPGTPKASTQVSDLTPRLGASFHPGAIQGFGANGSTVFLAGISAWDKPAGKTLPELASLTGSSAAVDVTEPVSSAFALGGVFGTVWNGSAWMISGEATWGTLNEGVLESLSGGRWTNLTPLVGHYFLNGGLWAVGWNGTSWLLAGNSSTGAAMVSMTGDSVTDLTGRLAHNDPGDFIQLLAWNGSAWIVGGLGIFGALAGGTFTDLYPSSPFTGGGAFAADWDGSSWLIGGGAPAALAVLRGTTLSAGPTLPAGFDRWVNAVVATSWGWVVVGKGSGGATGSTPELVLVSTDLSTQKDLSSLLPGAFAGGQIQFAGLAPWLRSNAVLLVGQGDLNEVTGYSVGAMAELDLGS